MANPAPPTCKARTKAGKPCRATQLGDDGLCRVHSPSSGFDPVETGRRGGRRSGAVRREQAKSVRDRLRDKVEEHADQIWAAYSQALDATNGEGQPDYRGRVQAADALLAQAYGKPLQRTEETGATQIVIIRPPRDTPADPPEQHADRPQLRAIDGGS